MSTPEIWKPIPGYNNKYIVSNKGNVAYKTTYGEYRGRKINYHTPYGSFSVTLNGKNSCIYLHRIVSSLFIGERPKGMVIRHLDGNKNNNKVENLKYGYPSENILDTIKHGSLKGIKNGRSKLDNRDVGIIKKLFKEKVPLSSIARAFDVSVTAINLIHKNKSWTHIK